MALIYTRANKRPNPNRFAEDAPYRPETGLPGPPSRRDENLPEPSAGPVKVEPFYGAGSTPVAQQEAERLQRLEGVLGENSIARATTYLREQRGQQPKYSEVIDLLEREYQRQIGLKGAKIERLMAQGLDPAQAEAQVFLAERLARVQNQL